MKAAVSRCRMACSVVVLTSVLIVAGCGGAASRLASHMARGQDYYSKGDYKHASIEFRNALQIAPKDTAARLMMAHTAEKLGQLRDAVGLYQGIVDSTPDSVDARASLGRLLAFGRVPQRALDVVEPGLVKHPDDVSLLTVRSIARMQLKKTDEARADADHALKLDPLNEEAIALRAGMYRQAGDTTAALALVSNGVQKLPRSTNLRQVLAELYLSVAQPEKAEEQLVALVRLNPTVMRYRKELALFYVKGKNLDGAQKVLEQAVKDLPKDDDAKLTLVSFLTSQRTGAEGERTLRTFIAQSPDNYELRFDLGELLQRSGNIKEALVVYEEVVRRDGNDGPKALVARNRIAGIDLAQGKSAEARKLVDQVLQKSPRDPDALLLRGELALDAHDPSGAIADLRAVLRDQPRSVQVQRLLARAYIANGELALAEQALRSAMDVAPGDNSVRISLAQLFARTQRADQAVALLEDTVRRSPKDADVREELVNAYLVKHDYAAAGSAANDLATLRPDSPAGVYLAGVAAQAQNKFDEAQADFERARAMKPQAIEPLGALARLEASRGQSAKAIALVQGAINGDDPKNAPALNLLGQLYLTVNDAPHAVEALNRATTIAPQWWPAYRTLGLARFAAHDPQGAVAAYTAALKIAPAEPQLVTELASLYERENRFDDAIAVYESLYQHDPKMPLAANNLAMMLVNHKTDRRSLDRARDLTASFSSSNDVVLLDTSGWVHFKRGEYAVAVPLLERAAERAPDAKEIRYHLGMAELQSGQNARARTDIEASLSGTNKFPWSDDARAVLASLKKDRTG